MRPTAFGEGRTDGSGLERGVHPRASRISRGHDLSLLRVLFVNRTRTKFSRSLANLPQLLKRCAQAKTREWPSGWRVVCTAHEFGAGSLAEDVTAARRADVLVGTHGAGLINAFFMHRGAVLVEARPYRFEGPWPDRYFRSLTSIERDIFYLHFRGQRRSFRASATRYLSLGRARPCSARAVACSQGSPGAVIHINGSYSNYVEGRTKGATFQSEAPKWLSDTNTGKAASRPVR